VATTYVYVAGAESGPVKIGFSTNVEKRIAELRYPGDTTQAPAEVDRSALKLLFFAEGDRDVERFLHYEFRSRRVLGEWFDLGPPSAAAGHVQDRMRWFLKRRDSSMESGQVSTAADHGQLGIPASQVPPEVQMPTRKQRRVQRQAVGRAKAAHVADLVQTLFEALGDVDRREGLRDLFPEVFCKCPGCKLAPDSG
jgi:hypothetical protein